MVDIQKEFISLLEEIGKEKGFRCQRYESRIRRTSNIIELFGFIYYVYINISLSIHLCIPAHSHHLIKMYWLSFYL